MESLPITAPSVSEPEESQVPDPNQGPDLSKASDKAVGPDLSQGPDQNIASEKDLDRLIDELESARIVPDPDIESIPATELETDIDDVVSETLARIYASQDYYAEASGVYRKLAVQHPDRKQEFEDKAAHMDKKSGSSG